jgi:hypothetical protein
MASLLVCNKDGGPLAGASVRVTIPASIFNDEFDRSYLTDERGRATISVNPVYAGATAHVWCEGRYERKTYYAAFDWAVGFKGLDPPDKEISLISTKEPEETVGLGEWLNEHRLAMGIIVVGIIGVGYVISQAKLLG